MTDKTPASNSYYSVVMKWPGVVPEKTRELRLISTVMKIRSEEKKSTKQVEVCIEKKPFSFVADTGSDYIYYHQHHMRL